LSNEPFYEPPVPISIVQLFDDQLRMRVEDQKAELIHDGSIAYVPFKGEQPVKSAKYKKSYLLYIGEYIENPKTKQREYKVFHYAEIRLIFDERRNVGYIKVSEEDRALMKEHKILDQHLPKEIENNVQLTELQLQEN
jgi:hypothetical protein